MNNTAYNQLLNLLMVSDPEPVPLKALKDWADEKAKSRGFDNWVDAYHTFSKYGKDAFTIPFERGDYN